MDDNSMARRIRKMMDDGAPPFAVEIFAVALGTQAELKDLHEAFEQHLAQHKCERQQNKQWADSRPQRQITITVVATVVAAMLLAIVVWVLKGGLAPLFS